MGERCGNVTQHLVRARECERPVLVEDVAQRSTWDDLHNEREAAVTKPPNGKQRDDVGMLELRDGARLARETGDRLIVVHELRTDDLDRDLAAELAIPRAIDDGSRTAAELAENLVVRFEIGRRDVRFGITKHPRAPC